ncbi:MAG: FxsA family protein [Pelagibacterales bacterium]|nr:FxsA family protein [Pelagibacterales bacterium]
MNSVLFLIISIPIIEIYLFIKVGSYIGAFSTISLILITAIIGIIYARYEGFNTLRSGMSQLVKNQIPFYEIISGAALAFAALLLILPGFATDIIGFFLIFPPTRKLLLKKVSNKYSNKNNKSNENNKKEDFINGEFEDIEEEKIEENKDEKL